MNGEGEGRGEKTWRRGVGSYGEGEGEGISEQVAQFHYGGGAYGGGEGREGWRGKGRARWYANDSFPLRGEDIGGGEKREYQPWGIQLWRGRGSQYALGMWPEGIPGQCGSTGAEGHYGNHTQHSNETLWAK